MDQSNNFHQSPMRQGRQHIDDISAAQAFNISFDQEVDIRQSYAMPSNPVVFGQSYAKPAYGQDESGLGISLNITNQEDDVAQMQPPIKSAKYQKPEIVAQTTDDEKCLVHNEKYILMCLKDQERVCSRCLNTNHLLHPVVPLSSLDQLDFHKSIQQEIQNSVLEIRAREPLVKRQICDNIRKHKISLRQHIIAIRENLREEFDDFFNNLLQSIRKDWNLFSVQEMLVKETNRFSNLVACSLNKITENQNLFDLKKKQEEDLRNFYEQLSDAQLQVQNYKEDWFEYERSVTNLMSCLKNHSEFDVIDSCQLRGFMAENFVMNYSNIELHRVMMQQKQEIRQAVGSGSPRAGGNMRHSFQQPASAGPISVSGNGRERPQSSQQFNNNYVRQARNEFSIQGAQRPMTAAIERSEMRSTNQNQQQVVNRIHFFKFDQKIVTYYDVDNDRRTREQLLQDFNIPIRFCSIQTVDGRIFITGGAKNSTQSSNHAYELREQALVQLPNMINAREGHCLAAIGSNYIYAIGSRLYNTSKTCEVFSIQRQQWREQPDLNRNRYLSTAVTIADRYIYVMGGYEPSVTDIERLDTESGEQPYWELIKVWSQSFENDIKYWFGACPISTREILIFGGKKDGASSASSYLFDTQLNQISKTGNMPMKDTFYQRTFLCKNQKVYAYGYENENAYIYSIQSQKWEKK